MGHPICDYKLFVLDMGFDLPDSQRDQELLFECGFSNITNSTSWAYQWQDSMSNTSVPDCLFMCIDDPPGDDKIYNRTWEDGKLGVGTVAEYVCIGT
jgi:hypothetical protein